MKRKLINIICIGFISILTAQHGDFKTFNYKKADSIALVYKDAMLTNLPLLAKNLTQQLSTEKEQFRAIYKWVTSNISNDFILTEQNEAKQDAYRNDSIKLKLWNTKISKKLYKQLIKRKSTICTGYAYLIKALCTYANIRCEMVHGYGRLSYTDMTKFKNPNHSWNAIKLDNKWYLADATWSSGIQNGSTLAFEFNYSDGYFLTDPKLFALNHYPLDEKWLLLAKNSFTFKDFLNAPVVYKNGFNYLNSTEKPLKLNNTIVKGEAFQLKYYFKNPVTRNAISLKIDNGYTTKTVKPELKTGPNNSLVITHQFKDKGFYDVHVTYKNTYVATYTANVK